MFLRTRAFVAASAAAAVALLGLATSAAATTEAVASHPRPPYQGPIDSAAGPPTVRPVGDATIAALQVALYARRLQPGPIDGLMGPETAGAIRRLQRRARLPVDGVVGPGTRAALGPLGRHPLGSRVLASGAVGSDVAALQFLLAWHGFPCSVFDGTLGNHTATAIRRFQRWAELPDDGRAGPATLAALRAPPAVSPITLAWPLLTRLGDPFGPRGTRFHSGIDLPAPAGAGIAAAGPGRVAWAGRRKGGWGLLVTIAHANGVRSMYAHLSRVDVRIGERVATGLQIGLVGATGHATGPHLHFELRLRGAAIDPMTALR